MQVYITVSSNNSTTTNTVLELKHNPYTIREIEQYIYVDTLDRDVIQYEIIEQFDNHDRKYKSEFTNRYNHEKISKNRFKKMKPSLGSSYRFLYSIISRFRLSVLITKTYFGKSNVQSIRIKNRQKVAQITTIEMC